MKTLIIATAMVAGLTTASYAGDASTSAADPVVMVPAEDRVAFTGYAEYFTEGETYEIGVGVELGLTNRFSVAPTLVFADSDQEDIDFKEIDIVAAYDLNSFIAMQGVFTLDEDLEYKETRFGTVLNVGYGLAFTPELLVDNDFDVQSLRLTAAYGITQNVGVYARVESDEDYEYSETAVGVSFKF